MTHVPDHELEAERERARRSRAGRSSTSSRAFESTTPARDVPCMGCGEPVELSGFAWDFAKQASRVLLDRGEQPLRNDEMTRCRPCADRWTAERAAKFGELCDRVAHAQREANQRGLVDYPLVDWLRKRGMTGWVEGIETGAARKNEGGTKGKGGKRMGDNL